MSGAPGGKKAAVMDAEHQAILDAQPITVRCALCRQWSFTGKALLAREVAKAHRKDVHPDIKPERRKRMPHLRAFRQPDLTEQDFKEVEDERIRRAFMNGVELEDVA
jgi:hypothetical protein